MCNARIIPCPHCGSEGRLYRETSLRDEYGNVMEHIEDCPTCEGTGGMIIEAEPITMEDLDFWSAP